METETAMPKTDSDILSDLSAGVYALKFEPLSPAENKIRNILGTLITLLREKEDRPK